jgi:hypothetical protein
VTGANGTAHGSAAGERSPGAASRVPAARVDAWLEELGIGPRERAERDGVTSWDIALDGRRRAGILVTLILDPSLALVCWVHYAPPIDGSFRISYRMLLRWNDELPFVKFAISEDERPVLTTEIPVATLDRDTLGVALARLVLVCDLLLDGSLRWLEPHGPQKGTRASKPATAPSPLLERYADRLGELATAATGGAEAYQAEAADEEAERSDPVAKGVAVVPGQAAPSSEGVPPTAEDAVPTSEGAAPTAERAADPPGRG